MTPAQEAIIEIFRDVLGVEVAALDQDVIEVGLLDSLGLVSLVAEMEERFAVRIPFETLDIDQFRTVGSIADLVEPDSAEAKP